MVVGYKFWVSCVCNGLVPSPLSRTRSNYSSAESSERQLFFYKFLHSFSPQNTMDIERLTKAVEQEYYRLKEFKKQEAEEEVKV